MLLSHSWHMSNFLISSGMWEGAAGFYAYLVELAMALLCKMKRPADRRSRPPSIHAFAYRLLFCLNQTNCTISFPYEMINRVGTAGEALEKG